MGVSETGLYVSCLASIPDQVDKNNLNLIRQKLGVPDEFENKHEDEYHISIIVAPGQVADLDAAEEKKDNGPFRVEGNKLVYWTGHNGKTYLVLELESEDLQELHQKWVDLGFKHSFPEYRPHMTLMKNFDPEGKDDLIEKINGFLQTNPIVLLASGEIIDGYKS